MANRIEFGSDFHFPELSGIISNPNYSLFDDLVLSSSGRAALFKLLERLGKWRRLWIPAYYCEDIILPLQHKYRGQLALYYDAPLIADDNQFAELFEPGDVVVRVNYFGLRYLSDWHKAGVHQILDLTHAINYFFALSKDVKAFASLRKTFPIPDGGISNQHLSLSIDGNHESLSWKRAFAMSLKAAYLTGAKNDKAYWRQLYLETEKEIGTATANLSEVSKSILDGFNVSEALQKKRSNLKYLITHLYNAPIYGDTRNYDNAFSLILNFENKERREAVRLALTKNNIYPAVYWPFSEAYKKKHAAAVLSFSDTSLSLPADFRYSERELDQVIRILKKVL